MEKAGSLRLHPDGRCGRRSPFSSGSEEEIGDSEGVRLRAATAGAAYMPRFKGAAVAMMPPSRLVYQRSQSLSEGKEESLDEEKKAFETPGPRRCVSVVSPFHGGDGGRGGGGGGNGGDKKDLEWRNDKILEE